MKNTELDKYHNIKEKLKSGIYQVTFTKTNGELRLMTCTLLEDYLPKTDKEVTKKDDESHSRIIVWDLDKEAWRSFLVNSVMGINEVL